LRERREKKRREEKRREEIASEPSGTMRAGFGLGFGHPAGMIPVTSTDDNAIYGKKKGRSFSCRNILD
jgi:hypothetical protein